LAYRRGGFSHPVERLFENRYEICHTIRPISRFPASVKSLNALYREAH
jgi:hypothetical protein